MILYLISTRQLLFFVLKCWHIQFGTPVAAWVIRCSTFIPQQQHTSDPQLRYKMGPRPIVLNGVISNDPLKMNGRKFVQNHGNCFFFITPKRGPKNSTIHKLVWQCLPAVFAWMNLTHASPDQGRSKPPAPIFLLGETKKKSVENWVWIEIDLWRLKTDGETENWCLFKVIFYGFYHHKSPLN